MNVRPEPSIDYRAAELQPGMAVPEAVFLDWIERQDAKFEYDRGTIGMIVQVTRNHSVLVGRFVYLLTRELENQPYEIHPEAFGVHTKDSIRFPDVLVQGLEPDGRALQSKTPLVIIEVLSPSSVYADHVVKRDEYLALPTLKAYIVADPNTPKLTIWQRTTTGHFSDSADEISGRDAVLHIRELGVKLRLIELYRDVR